MSADVAKGSELDARTRRLWLAILGSAAAFVATGALGWFVSGLACSDGASDLGPLPEAGVRILLGAIGVAGLAVAARGFAVGYGDWRAQGPAARVGDMDDLAGRDRYRFQAVVATLTSAAFLLGVLWEALPPIFLGVCQATR